MKILVINGPNMNLLGLREPDLYGKKTYADLCAFIADVSSACGVTADFFQSNHEGAIVDAIGQAYGVYDGIVINPAAYTHTSIAIPDALKAVGLPAVEVHMTDISAREAYRRVSYVREACVATFTGEGFESYAKAVRFLSQL